MSENTNRVRFDKTINLGHIVTALSSLVTVIVAVMISYSMIDKRLAVLEEVRAVQRERDQAQDISQREKFQEVRDALIDLRRLVEKVGDRVGAQ